MLYDSGKKNPVDGLAREWELLAARGHSKEIRRVSELPRIKCFSEQCQTVGRRIDSNTAPPLLRGVQGKLTPSAAEVQYALARLKLQQFEAFLQSTWQLSPGGDEEFVVPFAVLEIVGATIQPA